MDVLCVCLAGVCIYTKANTASMRPKRVSIPNNDSIFREPMRKTREVLGSKRVRCAHSLSSSSLGTTDMVDGIRIVHPHFPSNSRTIPSSHAGADGGATISGRAGGGGVVHGHDHGGDHQPVGCSAHEAAGRGPKRR